MIIHQGGRATTSINCDRPPTTPSSLAARFEKQISQSVATSSSPLQVFFLSFFGWFFPLFKCYIIFRCQIIFKCYIIQFLSQFLTPASLLLFPTTMEVTSRSKRTSVRVCCAFLWQILPRQIWMGYSEGWNLGPRDRIQKRPWAWACQEILQGKGVPGWWIP